MKLLELVDHIVPWNSMCVVPCGSSGGDPPVWVVPCRDPRGDSCGDPYGDPCGTLLKPGKNYCWFICFAIIELNFN